MPAPPRRRQEWNMRRCRCTSALHALPHSPVSRRSGCKECNCCAVNRLLPHWLGYPLAAAACSYHTFHSPLCCDVLLRRAPGSAVTSETRYIRADQPDAEFQVVLPREQVGTTAESACACVLSVQCAAPVQPKNAHGLQRALPRKQVVSACVVRPGALCGHPQYPVGAAGAGGVLPV